MTFWLAGLFVCLPVLACCLVLPGHVLAARSGPDLCGSSLRSQRQESQQKEGAPCFMQHGVHQDELSDDGLFTAVGLQFAIMPSSKEIGCH